MEKLKNPGGLSEADIIEIAKRYSDRSKSRETVQSIAKAFGVNRQWPGLIAFCVGAVQEVREQR